VGIFRWRGWLGAFGPEMVDTAVDVHVAMMRDGDTGATQEDLQRRIGGADEALASMLRRLEGQGDA
jgi:hypothetical protein